MPPNLLVSTKKKREEASEYATIKIPKMFMQIKHTKKENKYSMTAGGDETMFLFIFNLAFVDNHFVHSSKYKEKESKRKKNDIFVIPTKLYRTISISISYVCFFFFAFLLSIYLILCISFRFIRMKNKWNIKL